MMKVTLAALALLALVAGCAGQHAAKTVSVTASASSFYCGDADQVVSSTGWTGPLPGTGQWAVETVCSWHCGSLDGAPPVRVDVDFVTTSGGGMVQQVHSGVACD